MTEKTSQHPIVVPVDFSDYSEAALVHATEIAECHKTKVIVLHVVHDPADMGRGFDNEIIIKQELLAVPDEQRRPAPGFAD